VRACTVRSIFVPHGGPEHRTVVVVMSSGSLQDRVQHFVRALRTGSLINVSREVDAAASDAEYDRLIRGPLDASGNDALLLAVSRRSPSVVSYLCGRGFVPQSAKDGACALTVALRMMARSQCAANQQMVMELMMCVRGTSAFRESRVLRKRIFSETNAYNCAMMMWFAHGDQEFILDLCLQLDMLNKLELLSQVVQRLGGELSSETAHEFLTRASSVYSCSILLNVWKGEIRTIRVVRQLVQLLSEQYSETVVAELVHPLRVPKQWWVLRECALSGMSGLLTRLPSLTRTARNGRGMCLMRWSVDRSSEKLILLCIHCGLRVHSDGPNIVERVLLNAGLSNACCLHVATAFPAETRECVTRWQFDQSATRYRDELVSSLCGKCK
jgi:hypothetical protein